MKADIDDLILEFSQKRASGMGFKEIRKELESRRLDESRIKDVIVAVNDHELENLTSSHRSRSRVVGMVVSLAFVLLSIALWLWMKAKDFPVAYQWLVVIPVFMAVGNYLLFAQNAKKLQRK